MRSRILLAALALLPGCALAAALTATVTASGEQLTLAVCEPQPAAALRLYAASEAKAFVRSVSAPLDVQVRQSGDQIALTPWPGGCVEITIALNEIVAARQPDVGYRLDGVLLTASNVWLWRPNRPSRLQFKLPQNWTVSAPFSRCGRMCFELLASSADGPALIAMGALDMLEITVPGGVIEATVLPTVNAAERATVVRVVATLPKLLRAAYGRLPVPRLQVLMVPMRGRSNEAIPWGQVYRGGLGGVHFFVDPTRPFEDFESNWVIAHELSHLFHPYLGRDARWLSEGLASYQQQTLRAHAGLISSDTAWRGLLQGFARGRAARLNVTLPVASAQMHTLRAYMPVYWGGAAYWLDVEAQLLQARALSLNQVLDRFARCCLPETRAWNGQDFLAELDRLAETTLFSDTAQRYQLDTGFPPIEPLLARLGVRLDGERIVINARAPWRQTRNLIMKTP